MKKRILGIALATIFVVSQAVTVFAEDSKIGGAALTGASEGKYEITEATEENMAEVAESAPEILEKILAVNAGNATLQSITEMAPELEEELAEKEMLTPFFDLKAVDGGVKTESGKYQVTFSVPALTENVEDVAVLHYSTVRNIWEIIDASYADKEVTAEFEDLSPVAVIAKVDTTNVSDSVVGTSPKTGIQSGWLLWIGAAGVFAAVSIVSYRRIKKENNR